MFGLLGGPVAVVYCNDLTPAARSCCETSADCGRSAATAASDSCCRRAPAEKDKAELGAKTVKPLRSLPAAMDAALSIDAVALPALRVSLAAFEAVTANPAPSPPSVLRL